MDEEPSNHHHEIIEEGLREEEVVGDEPDINKVKAEEDIEIKVEPDEELNRRGMPRRIRKKNKLFYDDNMFNAGSSSPRQNKTPTKTPVKKSTPSSKKKRSPPSVSKSPPISLSSAIDTTNRYSESISSTSPNTKRSRVRCSSPDADLGQRVGIKLRNLLKLPKAYRFVCYEFFYSNIDRPLFDNDFITCLEESFPYLTKYVFHRSEWSTIRRMMGKPRRCSSNFFTEERINLEKKRNIIRFLHQGKCHNNVTIKDIPPRIPIQMVVGTKVTARIRSPPQDGLFTGVVDAYDTSNNTYRITFDRQGLGTRSIPDYEVLSNDTPETIERQRFLNMFGALSDDHSEKPQRPELLDSDNMEDEEKMGEYPVELLEKIVCFRKLLALKNEEVHEVRNMNSEAERKQLYGELYDRAFQKKYAGHILKLSHINKDLNRVLAALSVSLKKLKVNPNVSSQLYSLSPADLQQETYIAAQEVVDSVNKLRVCRVEDQAILLLITDAMALILQIRALSHSSRRPYEAQVLQQTMEDICKKLSASNQSVFENRVSVHMEQIRAAMSGENKSTVTLCRARGPHQPPLLFLNKNQS